MRMIAHSYDTYDQAVRAVNALEAAGVAHDDISLVSGDKDRTIATTVSGDTAAGAGTGASIGTVLGGGAGLLAGLGSLAIPGVGPVVAAGWLIATLTGAGIGAAAGGLIGSLTGAGVDEGDAQGYAEHVGRGGTLVTVRASDEMAAEAEYILEHGSARTAAPVAAPMAAPTAAPVAAMSAPAPARAMGTGTAAPVAAMATGPASADDTLKVVKEDLVVGKRAVEQGAVRVTSHVVETPVEEQVSLHQERVVVDRRPVNRPLTGVSADAFRERTLAATATSEEAVVGKEARVVEEIGLRKAATDRVETVRDTVRETKVDVDQVPGSGTVSTGGTSVSGGLTGAGSQPSPVRDNAATRAVDRTLGSNLSGENPSKV